MTSQLLQKKNINYATMEVSDNSYASDFEKYDEKYYRIMNSLNEGVYIINLLGNCLFINSSAKKTLGYEECYFPTNKTIHEIIHTESETCCFDNFDGETHSGFQEFIKKDGEVVTISYVATPLIESNQVIGSVIIFKNDSKQLLVENSLRESEARYRALYNSTPSMLLSIDSNGNVIEVSDMWLKKMGYNRGFVRGRSITQFVTKECQLEIQNILDTAKQKGKYSSNKLNFFTNGGDIVETDTEVVAERNNDKELERFLVVSADVTEKRKTEMQLMQSQKMEAIGQLTGGIAHDFNNILQVIIGNLQILERKKSGDASDKELQKIQRAATAADKARDLTKRLLAFSRRQVLKTKHANFNNQLLEFKTFLTRSLREDIELKLDLADDLWMGDIDLSQFENSILNLCVNSAGAMSGGGQITIKTENRVINDKISQFQGVKISGDYIAISIVDNGHGIPNEILPNIIEPFFTTKDKDKGTGLGLSMVYGFVEQTGGFMEVSSDVGCGTCITLFFPRTEKEDANSQKTFRKKEPVIKNGNRKVILLVEDNKDVQDVIISILEEQNYKVFAFERPFSAKQAVDEGLEFDMLLTDVLMPGNYRGTDLADLLKETHKDLKTLFLSGYSHDSFFGDRSLGPNEKYLSKPIDNDDLLTSVQSLLEEEKT